MKAADFVTRLYSWLLRLYPRAFYDRFAQEMCVDFRDAYAAARRAGARNLAAFLVRAYSDVALSLAFQWRNTESLLLWGRSVAAVLSIWTAALLVAALEWPRGPVTAWFVMQFATALTAGATLTIGIALRRHNAS